MLETIGERVKYIRKNQGMNQQEFADALGMSKSMISKIEINATPLSERTLKDICRVFKVSEYWLREKKGGMYEDVSRTKQIANFIDDVMLDSNDDFKKRLVLYLSKLTVQDWEALSQIAKKLKEDED